METHISGNLVPDYLVTHIGARHNRIIPIVDHNLIKDNSDRKRNIYIFYRHDALHGESGQPEKDDRPDDGAAATFGLGSVVDARN